VFLEGSHHFVGGASGLPATHAGDFLQHVLSLSVRPTNALV
jgi:hypothetical protein